MAQECELFLTAHPEWDSVVAPPDAEKSPSVWYWRNHIRWTPIHERFCGKHAFGNREEPMTPKHFAVAQEILLRLMYHERVAHGWNKAPMVLDPKEYITRLYNVKTKETIPGEIYAL